MHLYTAGENHLQIVRDIACRTWPEAYSKILSEDQLHFMLDLFYSLPSLHGQLKNGHRFRICESGNKAVGFSSVSVKEGSPGILRLNKLYVLPTEQGSGAGKLLLDDVKAFALEKGFSAVELNVNRNNRARFFYEKEGFLITREIDIAIGEGYFMNDYIMSLPLNP